MRKFQTETMLAFAEITAEGQTAIPQDVRAALHFERFTVVHGEFGKLLRANTETVRIELKALLRQPTCSRNQETLQ